MSPETYKGLNRDYSFYLSTYHIRKAPLRPQKLYFFANADTVRLRREIALLWRAKIQYSDFLFLFLNSSLDDLNEME